MNPIKILGHLMLVFFDDKMSVKRNVSGECCSNTGEIRINSQVLFSQQRDTLIHEILEAVNYNLELDLKHNQITSIACAFQQVFNDNPHVLDFLKAEGRI